MGVNREERKTYEIAERTLGEHARQSVADRVWEKRESEARLQYWTLLETMSEIRQENGILGEWQLRNRENWETCYKSGKMSKANEWTKHIEDDVRDWFEAW